MGLELGPLASSVAAAIVVAWLVQRMLGRWSLLAAGIGVPVAIVLSQWLACRQAGSCEGPGDAFMLMFWGPLALVWLAVAGAVFWFSGGAGKSD